MKHLLIIRHAKSSWDEPALTDFDRPLNGRGRHDAPLMGQVIASRGIRPERILSSAARRARQTAKRIARELGVDPADIELREDLYLAEAGALQALLQTLDDRWNQVFLVGHNPGLTDLANQLCDAGIGNIPTCGIVAINFDVSSWSHLMAGSGRLVFFDFPKQYR